MKARPISLDDFVLSGGGFNGESYNHKTDPALMLKLYFPGKIKQPLDEMNLARKVYDMGIPTPEPGEYVITDDGRYGILFRRINRKKSLSRATGENPMNVGKYASVFAQMCLKLHSTHVDISQFESVKDRYYRLLLDNPFFTNTEKDKLTKFIADTPYADTAIHGDLQFSNVIFAGDKYYFIDLGDFCYGNPLFDLGMVYLCSNLSQESFIRETFHMSKSVAIEFWRKFVPEYFGQHAVLSEVEEMLLPYAGLKTLIIERDAGQPQPEFRAALRSILD